MTFQGQLLLPSQEALIERLHHVASYSDQLLVLSGASGSGKTTLATALATDVDDANVALVICPMHAEDAEIRRKILVQLVSSPIFDDETPLAETILRVAPNQSKPLHIIIDDAHLLSKELWAECIILNQIQCAGRRIALTLTVPPAFLAELLPQLPDSLRRQLLPVNVEPLTLPEREALYQTLLRYSDQNPFTPRDIVRGLLEKQKGTPREVVELLELALHGSEAAPSFWQRYRFAFVGAASLLVTLIIWLLLASPEADKQISEQVTYPALDSPQFLRHGEQILQPYFSEREVAFAKALADEAALKEDPLANFHGEEPQSEGDVATAAIIGEASLKGDSAEQTQIEEVNTNSAQTDNTQTQKVQAESTQIEKADENAISSSDVVSTMTQAQGDELSSVHPLTVTLSDKPSVGYAIQVSTVQKLSTAQALAKKINTVADVRITKYKQFWVVFVGQYSDKQSAEKAATELDTRYHLSQPLIKNWADLGNYALEETFPHREI
ncbi:AAA family ATPase [Shewanella acanthi]|uniref:AAA family ATPase n=1 Tax=Shewanella acanthi TaxID=2864212 RepID=UPI001C65ACD5|nr:AAA family ATPase [Shewanella acanthi]QYJ78626.1 AAA family ATPase [Shewanella acanthi]